MFSQNLLGFSESQKRGSFWIYWFVKPFYALPDLLNIKCNWIVFLYILLIFQMWSYA